MQKGEAGELELTGPNVMKGYWNDPEKTAASFVTLPDGKPAYRTGDRAVLSEDGNVRFLGRVDNQVKVRGFRIELGEIEAVAGVVTLKGTVGNRESIERCETAAADVPGVTRVVNQIAYVPEYVGA